MKQIKGLDLEDNGVPIALCWSPDGRYLAVNRPQDSVSIYAFIDDLSGIDSTPQIVLETGPATELRWSADGQTLTVIDESRAVGALTVTAWSAVTWDKLRTQFIPATPLSAWDAEFSFSVQADGNRLILPDRTVEVSHAAIDRICMSAGGTTLVVTVGESKQMRSSHLASEDQSLRRPLDAIEVWDLVSGLRVNTWSTSLHQVTEISISPDGRFFILRGYYQGGDGIGDVRRDFSIFERTKPESIFRDWGFGFLEDVPMLPAWAADSQQVLYWAFTKRLSGPGNPYISVFDTRDHTEKKYRHSALAAMTPATLAWTSVQGLLAIGDVSGGVTVFRL